MKVFVTGGTGFIGSGAVDILLKKGYSVIGLARSDASAEALEKKGCAVIRGDLEDHEALRKGASEADGVIHFAYIHKFDSYINTALIDKEACLAMLSVLEGTDKPFVYTNGTGVLKGSSKEHPAGEDAEYADPKLVGPRGLTEQAVLEYADKGVRASTIRLPFTVHGDLDKHGFIRLLIAAAKRDGYSFYVGDGQNAWPAVNYQDAQPAFVLALERAKAGDRFNVVGEAGVPFKSIAEAIGKKVGVPTKSVTAEEAAKSIAFVGILAGVNNYVSSDRTRKQLGWMPTHSDLLDDIRDYYN